MRCRTVSPGGAPAADGQSWRPISQAALRPLLNDRGYKEEHDMHYISTRGRPERRKFCEILLEGLAPDGGLYVLENYPLVDDVMLNRWRGLSYPDLAFEILSLYIDDIPPADLKAICAKTYTSKVFGTDRITPVRTLETGLHVAELSNGPTLAFKDIAMQLLGNLL